MSNLGIESDPSSTIFMRRRLGCPVCLQRGASPPFHYLRKNYIYVTERIIDAVLNEGIIQFSKIDLNGIELGKFIFIFTGRYSIPLFFILLLMLNVYRERDNIRRSEIKRMYMLYIILAVATSYQIILLINPFISHSTDRILNLNYIVFGIVPLFALLLGFIFRFKFRIGPIIIVSFLLTIIFSLSMYGAFFSPNISRANMATTYNELSGMEWLFNYKNEDQIRGILGTEGYRYSSLINDAIVHKERLGKDVMWSNAGFVPDHFGYDKNKYFGESSIYMVVTTMSEQLYQTVYKKVGRFNASDFLKLNSDPHIYKIFESLNLKIYKAI